MKTRDVKMSDLELAFAEAAMSAVEKRVAWVDHIHAIDYPKKVDQRCFDLHGAYESAFEVAEKALRALRDAETEEAAEEVRAECRAPKPIGVR